MRTGGQGDGSAVSTSADTARTAAFPARGRAAVLATTDLGARAALRPPAAAHRSQRVESGRPRHPEPGRLPAPSAPWYSRKVRSAAPSGQDLVRWISTGGNGLGLQVTARRAVGAGHERVWQRGGLDDKPTAARGGRAKTLGARSAGGERPGSGSFSRPWSALLNQERPRSTTTARKPAAMATTRSPTGRDPGTGTHAMSVLAGGSLPAGRARGSWPRWPSSAAAQRAGVGPRHLWPRNVIDGPPG